MENNKGKKIELGSLKNLAHKHSEGKPASGELSDQELDQVSGGAILNRIIYIAQCPICKWQSNAFDNLEYDAYAIMQRHKESRNCDGELIVYEIDTNTVGLSC